MAATLDDLLKILKEMKEADKAASDARKDESKRIEGEYKKFFLGAEVSRAIGLPGNVAQPYAFIGQISQMVNDRRELMASLNKQSLAFGENVATLRKTAEVKSGASEFGPTIALKTSIDAMRYGIFGLSKNTLDLGMQMQAVGESSDALFNMQRQSQVLGGMQASQMDSLSKSLENARSQYGISTQYLVEAIGALSERLLDFNLMGITSEVNEAMVGLVSKYGQGTADLFSKAINSLTSGGNISKFARFGISEDVAGLMESGGMTTEAVEAIAAKAGDFFSDQVANFRSLNKAEAIAQAKAIYGEEGALFAAIAKLEGQGAKGVSPEQAREQLKSQIDIQRDMAASMLGAADSLAILTNYAPWQLLNLIAIAGLLVSINATLGGGLVAKLMSGLSGFFVSFGATIMTTLGSIAGSIVGVLAPIFGPILAPLLLIGVLVGAIYGLYKFFEDPKPVQIAPPKTGGQFITNEYMVANAELTKGILGSVFASQQMLMLAQAKQQTQLMAQNNQLAARTAKNTGALNSPITTPIQSVQGP